MRKSAFLAVARVVSFRTIFLAATILILVFFLSILLVSAANVFSRALYSMVSLSDNEVVVYGSGSHPYTATTSMELLTRVLMIVHDKRVCPEISVIVRARNEVFLARATDSKCLVGPGVLVEAGKNFSDNGAIIGSVLAEHLSVKIGDFLVLESLQANRSALLRIVAVFNSDGPLGSEIILTANTARYLRGFSSDTYSYVRITNVSELELGELEKLVNQTRVRGVIPSLIVNLLRHTSIRSPAYYPKNMVLDPGEIASLTRGITLSSLATSIVLSLGVLLALPATISKVSSDRLKALIVSGMSERIVIRAFNLLCWFIFLVAVMVSTAMFIIAVEAGWLEYRFLFHYWRPELTPVDTLSFFVAASLVYCAGLRRIRGEISWIEEF